MKKVTIEVTVLVDADSDSEAVQEALHNLKQDFDDLVTEDEVTSITDYEYGE